MNQICIREMTKKTIEHCTTFECVQTQNEQCSFCFKCIDKNVEILIELKKALKENNLLLFRERKFGAQ